jgi:SAM-dependent methyltransferase
VSSTWEEAQALEAGFWGTCANTYGEETKQLLYAEKMGLRKFTSHSIDGGGWSYLDVGGGPASMLLKFVNAGRRVVVDPCPYPRWVYDRYAAAGVESVFVGGEDLASNICFDVALIYNVLQHVRDPEAVVRNARRASRELRMFEWVDIPPHPGHPHCLTQADLERWAGVRGQVEEFARCECYGRAWFCGK